MGTQRVGNAQAPERNALLRSVAQCENTFYLQARAASELQHLPSFSLPATPGPGVEMQKITPELIEAVVSLPAAFPTLAKFDLKLIS